MTEHVLITLFFFAIRIYILSRFQEDFLLKLQQEVVDGQYIMKQNRKQERLFNSHNYFPVQKMITFPLHTDFFF